MDPRERTVSFFDLRVESKFRSSDAEPAPVPMIDALDIAHAMWRTQHPVLGKGKVQIALDDWVIDGRDQCLVFNRADASLEDIPLKDLQTRKRRMAGKTVNEGIDLTAHVLIRLGRAKHSAATLLMTGGSNLQSAKISTFLGLLFRAAKAIPKYKEHFRRPHPSGEKDAFLPLHSKFRLDGHESQLLEDILRKGQLSGVQLIADASDDLDTERTFVVTEKILSLDLKTPGSPLSVRKMREAIRSASTILGDGVDRARLSYRPPGHKHSQTQTIPVAELEQAFVRKDRIRFDFPIQPLYEHVQPHIMDKLRRLL